MNEKIVDFRTVRTILAILAIAPFYLLGQPTEMSSLHVHIKGLEEVKGKVAIALCDSSGESVDEYWLFVEDTSVYLDVPQIESGSYAIKFFHDANNNGKMDKNFIGIPTEMFGFSNDAKVKLGPPDLEEMLFRVDGRTDITIHAKKI